MHVTECHKSHMVDDPLPNYYPYGCMQMYLHACRCIRMPADNIRIATCR